MVCGPDVLKSVPLFALLDDDETDVLAAQVELKSFAARERIYKRGDPGGQAFVMLSGQKTRFAETRLFPPFWLSGAFSRIKTSTPESRAAIAVAQPAKP